MEFFQHALDFLIFLFNFVLKIDQYLGGIIKDYGLLTYLILFLIIFCETGLVVTPILPGDSLLFAAGAFAAKGLLDARLLILIITVAAILGDMVNYTVGRFFGAKLFQRESRYLKKSYIDRTHSFFETHGDKAIIFCRFVPIVRTFTPFVAGFGKMTYSKFMIYNCAGAVAWAVIFIAGGYFFGDLPIIRESLTLTILAIVFISVIPFFWQLLKLRKSRNATNKMDV